MKRKLDPLVEHGHRVFVSYDGPAFESRTVVKRSGFSYQTTRNPTKDFQSWLENTAGPLGTLWTTVKSKDHSGIEIYFYKAEHAMLAKLTWGGR
jgi:hypothetical protein